MTIDLPGAEIDIGRDQDGDVRLTVVGARWEFTCFLRFWGFGWAYLSPTRRGHGGIGDRT